MSIQSEIARIQAAKMEIIAALKRKGVEIPDGIKIEDIPPYIDAIVVGASTTAELGTAVLGTMRLGSGSSTPYILGEAKLGSLKLGGK